MEPGPFSAWFSPTAAVHWKPAGPFLTLCGSTPAIRQIITALWRVDPRRKCLEEPFQTDTKLSGQPLVKKRRKWSPCWAVRSARCEIAAEMSERRTRHCGTLTSRSSSRRGHKTKTPVGVAVDAWNLWIFSLLQFY